jgi:hypothetical protein
MRAPGRIALVLGGLLLASAPGSLRAEVAVHGFVEGAYGLRTAESPVHEDSQDYTLEETRAQVRLTASGDAGEAFVRLDVLGDRIAGGGTDLELREGFFRFTTLNDHLDVKIGRQALTWGTGDLVFINDLFPKDWESFFAGRDDQYLIAPSDAIRLAVFGLPFDIDVVLTPRFTPDRLPEPGGERFSLEIPPGIGATEEPAEVFENGEVAVRISRYVGDFTASLYGYRGFFKTPEGLRAAQTFVGSVQIPYHPKLSVFGASLRGAAAGGVVWLEGGFYDSREDRDGNQAAVRNQSTQILVGWERQLFSDFNITLQYFGEFLSDATTFVGIPEDPPPPPPDEQKTHLLTLRAEKLLHYQTIRLSFFTFYDPEHEDAYLRPLGSYKLSDEVEVVVGANVFFDGDAEPSTFGRFDRDDNVYARLRYSF